MTSKYAVAAHNEFIAASNEALQTPNLQLALSRLGETLAAGNKSAFEKLPGSSLLRDKARAIKDETLAQLDVHIQILEAAVRAKGGHVHYAADAADANEIVERIAKERGIRRVVKSKSMVTEEIHLNHHLEQAGIEVTETDFGEFIIQVAGERPSHLVGPALHKTAEEMAVVLNERFDQQLSKEPHEMAQFARGYLRQKFAQAEMGVTGGNFLVAETGTVVLISNEGNARLTTSVPRVMVSVVGIEKVIPQLSDLPIFLKVLARAATGQKLSIYTSMITGPRREGEGDGPEEFHLVLLDNGRSRILGSPSRESLFCIRCGACLRQQLLWPDRRGHLSSLRRTQADLSPTARQQSLWSLSGGLPGQDPDPRAVDPQPRGPARREGGPRRGRADLPAVELGDATAPPLPLGRPRGSVDDGGPRPPGLGRETSRPSRRLDRPPRLSRPRRQTVP